MAKNESINAGAGIDPELLYAAAGGVDQEGPVAPPAADPSVAELQSQIAALMLQNQTLMAERAANAGDDAVLSDQASSKERFGILIDEGSGPNDPPEVPVQVNGRAYQIRRGAYVEVPREVVSVLTDAVTDKTISLFDAAGMPNGTKVRPSRRYPFREFGMVIDAEGRRLKAPPQNTGE